MAILFLMMFFLFSYASACDQCVLSKAAVFSTASTLSSGACGYGSLALKFNGGHVAAGAPSLYKDGAGCGACFQIRCKNSAICNKEGTKVIVSDVNKSSKNNNSDFVMSSRAFKAMALPGKDLQVLKLGVVNVEYKRVACDYKHQNMALRVEESSKNPGYLAVKIVYQGGQTEIVAVDVAKVGSSKWTFMTRKHGAIWETNKYPGPGPLQFRFVVTAGFDGKSIWAKNVLPSNWKPGVTYDTNVQIDDIALEGCTPCADSHWH